MLQYLLEKEFTINGIKIVCKVTGAPATANDGQPYVLDIPAGPGAPSTTYMAKFLQKSKSPNLKPHVILFDFPGCGQSEKSKNPEFDYTIEHFTEIAARVVECVQDELNIGKLDLHVYGPGTPIGLNLPLHRPQWTTNQDSIQLKSIFAPNATVGIKGTLSADFVRQHYAYEPEFPEYIKALDKLHTGKITSRKAYISEYLAPMAPAYSDQYKSLPNKLLLSALKNHPDNVVKILKLFRRKASLEIVNGFSYEVLNQFYGSQWNGFELDVAIDNFNKKPWNKNKNVYSKIPIYASYQSHDFCTSGDQHLNQLQAMLPDVCGILRPGKIRDFKNLIFFSKFLSGDLEKFENQIRRDLSNRTILKANFTPGFRKSYEEAFKSVAKLSNKSTTHYEEVVKGEPCFFKSGKHQHPVTSSASQKLEMKA